MPNWSSSKGLHISTQFQAPFIQIDEFKHRLYSAGRQTDLGETLVQSLGAGIAPSSFHHESIPYFDFLLAGLAAMSKGPGQQGGIAAALKCFALERRVIEVQELATA